MGSINKFDSISIVDEEIEADLLSHKKYGTEGRT